MTDPDRIETLATTVGNARAHFYVVPRGVPRATLVLGHGAGAGVETWDLQILASRLPGLGIEVVLVEQPWRVEGKKVAPAAARLDAGFREVVTGLRRAGEGLRELVVGGRSAGARVACRTAADIKADSVLCLAFPLHRPGRTSPNRADELAGCADQLQLTVIQGERDSFGRPTEIATALAGAGAQAVVVSVPWADHSFKLPGKATITQAELSMVLVDATERAILHRTGNRGALTGR
ncbi:MAG: hydrolase [Actinobacteria bacterium]|nr:hydrolase [Actinomycetota bacterium]